MKYNNRFACTLGSIVLITLFCISCPTEDNRSDTGTTAVVAFALGYDGAAVIPSITVDIGTAAGSKWPANPSRPGFAFTGWYYGTTLYNAETIISGDVTVTAQWLDESLGLEDQPAREVLEALFDTASGFPVNLSNSWKIWNHRNPLATQGFGADPTATVYNDRVYLYMSNDTLLYDPAGNPYYINQAEGEFSYGRGIQGIRMLSSADLANWTDHGAINIVGPVTSDPLIESWEPITSIPGVDRSWAPVITWKRMGGKDRFFLYWGNGGNGIGVVTADSPTGPWTSPLNKLLIDRNTPNCSNVIFLFDPGVVIDDDRQAYLFFGGGTDGLPSSAYNNTGQARRVRLNPDMISLADAPETWHVPYLFEASDIQKIKGRYYFSYSTHGNTGGNPFGLSSAQIAYMMSDHPYGSFSDPKRVLTSASLQLASKDTNNHHVMFEFKGEAYMAYHTQKLAEAMGIYRYRATSIDKMIVNADGTLEPVIMTRKGVDQAGYLNPYIPNEAETIGIQGGIYTRPESGASNGMVVTSIDTGNWVALYGVDFGAAGAHKFTARVRTPESADYIGAIELRINPEGNGITSDTGNLTATNTASIKNGEVIGRLRIKAKPGEEGKYAAVTIDLDRTVTGVNNLVFVFYSSLGARTETTNRDSRHKNGFEFDQWQFYD